MKRLEVPIHTAYRMINELCPSLLHGGGIEIYVCSLVVCGWLSKGVMKLFVDRSSDLYLNINLTTYFIISFCHVQSSLNLTSFRQDVPPRCPDTHSNLNWTDGDGVPIRGKKGGI